MGQFKPRKERAFTLVELLVVIAIIGVLVALLLPAIQAAREAARRTQCTNQVKQLMTAMLNHEGARKVFPSGGIAPWPTLENYLNGPGGAPFGPEKQGLGWPFQILPYIEGQNLYNLKTQYELDNTVIPTFNCPSRRGPTRNGGVNINVTTDPAPYLIDYAAAVPYPSPSFLGYGPDRPQPPPWFRVPTNRVDNQACLQESLWGNRVLANRPVQEADCGPIPQQQIEDKTWFGFWGVIVRSNMVVKGGQQVITGYYTPISFQQIEDGSSNTMVLGEKRLEPQFYSIGDWHDDRGWTGGWDPDSLRSTICSVGADKDNDNGSAGNLGFQFGSAHSSGLVTGFADGSVHFLSYDIDLELFNNFGHRSDGANVSMEAL